MADVKDTPKKAEAVDGEKSLGQVFSESVTQPMPRNVAIALLVAFAITAVSIILASHFGVATKVRGWIQGAGVWAPLVYIGLKASTYVIAPLSGTPVKLAGGALFGFWDGAFYILVGDMLGACLNFWIARLFRDRGIKRVAGSKAMQQINGLMDKVGGWRVLLVARLMLSSLYDFISYAAGLSKLPFRQFFWVSLLAGAPSTLLAAWLGNAAFAHMTILLISLGVSAVILLSVIFLQPKQPTQQK